MDTESDLGLQLDKIHKAVKALFVVLEKQKEKKKVPFIEEGEKVHLQFTLKKIPNVENKNIRIKLPNSMQTDQRDVCLFVKDLDKKQRDYTPTVLHFKELLEKHGISEITEIIPLKSLKIDHTPYEAKRILAGRFDVFLGDKRIIRFLPSYLGKAFYGKKRHPIGVNLAAKNLKKEIGDALDSSRCVISGRGSSCLTAVGHTQMTVDQIAENVISTANQLGASIPGGSVNIKNMHIKTNESLAIPIYIGGDEEVILPELKKVDPEPEPEEVTTVLGAKVKVTPDGHVSIIPNKRGHDDDEKTLLPKKRKLNKKSKQTQSKKPVKKIRKGRK